MYELMTALQELIQAAFERQWSQDNRGEYVPLKFFISGLPPRSGDGYKDPYVLMQPLSGEDKDDMETFAIDICPCIYVDRVKDDVVTQQEEGNGQIINLMDVIKTTIRDNRIVGKKYLYADKMSWSMLDDNPQPTPYFRGIVRCEYENRIVTKLTKSEEDAYGANIK